MEELRKMNCDVGWLSRSDGSAFYSSGETCVAVSVNGPCTGQSKISVDEAVLDVCYRPRCGATGLQDKLVEGVLRKTAEFALLLNQFPRAVIFVTVQELMDCGGLLAGCINGMCLAFMHSGLPMRSVFAAVCCCVDQQDRVHVDPDGIVLKDSKAVFTLTMDQEGGIASSDISGRYTKEQFNEVLEKSRAASKIIFQFYRDVFTKFSNKIAL